MDYARWIRSRIGNDRLILNYAGCVIFNDQGQILLQKRRDKELWGFMGGIIELGESASEAAIREVFEESGLVVKIEKLLGIYTKYFDEYQNGDKTQPIIHMFIAKTVGGSLIVENDETMELKYFDLNNVPELFNQQHNDILNDVIQGNIGVFR